MLNFMGVLNATSAAAAAHANVSCSCNCKRAASYSSTEITQLEFVQILVIVMVMMVMVVVITCLLNHYRLSARSLLSRHGHNQRRHLSLANETGLCSSAAPRGASGLNEQQVYVPRPPSRGLSASYLHRDLQSPQSQSSQRFQYSSSRFQPTYPYLPQSLIDLPPTISLSDGEEPPPYQGPCTLQLRNSEQQMELNRESVRAPPNRTVYDSHLLDPSPSCLQARLQGPPPNGHAGLSTLEAQEFLAPQQKHRPHLEGAPPAYSEVIGHYYHPTSLALHHHHETAPASLNPPSSLEHGLIRHTSQQQAPPTPGSVDNRNARNQKEKSHNPQQV